MHTKGAGYDAAETVAQAIAVAGVSPEVFFKNAQIFTRTNGYDSAAAAKRYEDSKADPKVDPQLPQAVITLADWVMTKDSRAVQTKFESFDRHRPSRH